MHEASQITLSDSFAIPAVITHVSQPVDDHQWLVDFMEQVTIHDLTDNDAAITFFVSGYIGRAIHRRRKCSSCKDMLVLSVDCLDIYDCVPEKHKELFEMVDRGGLSQQSDYCYGVTSLAVLYYSAIAAEKSIMGRLMRGGNQRSIFLSAVRSVINSGQISSDVLNVSCDMQHINFDLIVQTAFNCFAKNELKRLNASRMAEEPPAKQLRKIRKLTSKASGRS